MTNGEVRSRGRSRSASSRGRQRSRPRKALADGGPDRPLHFTGPDGRHASLRRLVCDLIEDYGRHTGAPT